MSRAVSSTFKQAVFAQQTTEVFVVLLEIYEASLSAPLRVCNDSQQTDRDYSIRNATYKWTLSGSGTNEYYMELAAGGDPEVMAPNEIYEDGASAGMVAGTLGSLSAGEHAYGDNDSLDYETIYVRLTDSTDPDSKAVDYLMAEENYLSYPFVIQLPDEPETGVSIAKIIVDNVDQAIVQAVRNASSPPTVNIRIVLASAPNTVEVELKGFELVNALYDATQVSGDVSLISFMREPYPGDSFLPSNFPGLF